MNRRPRNTLLAWIDDLRSEGRISFTKIEAGHAYAQGPALTRALDRLLSAKILAKPKKGFYVILDPPYRRMGSLPPEWYIDPLMKHLGLPYYVGGLSAAAYFGASHHAAQEFQVIVPGDRKGLRPIRCGQVRIHLLLKSDFKAATIQDMKTQTGTFKAASVETTAWDLVFFQRSVGGLDQVATLLIDLVERLDPDRLAKVAEAHHDGVTTRRLGWLLQTIGAKRHAAALRLLVADTAAWRPLAPFEKVGPQAVRSDAWRLLINHELDPDA